MSDKNIKAMILAAGLGTRLKPWTDHHPKALAIVNGKSLLQRNIEYLQKHGIRDVVVSVHHFADQIINAINKNRGWGSNVIISYETDEPLETGGGLLNAAELLQNSEAFLLMNVDILTNLDVNEILQFHFNNKPLATLAVTNRKTSRYFLFNNEGRLCGWRNVQTGEERSVFTLSGNETEKAFSGLHIIDDRIFRLIQQKGRFSIVDSYLQLMKDHSILSFDHSENKFIDVGKPENIEKAETMFA